MLFSQAVEGWGEGSFSSFHSPQPTAELRPAQCLLRRAQSKFEIAKYGKSAGRSEKAEGKKEVNIEGPATSPQNRQTLQLGGKGVKQWCEKRTVSAHAAGCSPPGAGLLKSGTHLLESRVLSPNMHAL